MLSKPEQSYHIDPLNSNCSLFSQKVRVPSYAIIKSEDPTSSSGKVVNLEKFFSIRAAIHNNEIFATSPLHIQFALQTRAQRVGAFL